MKVALVYFNIGFDKSVGYQLGLASIASCLISDGIEVKYFVINNLTEYLSIKDYAPDVIGIYCIEFMEKYINALIKEYPDTYYIAGGPYPTIYPKCIDTLNVNAIFRGEGEVQFLRFIKSNLQDTNIPGFVFRDKANDPAPRLTEDELRSLPYPYRGEYANEAIAHDKCIRWESKGKGSLHYIVSRGCPYNCAFCANSIYNEIWGINTIFRTVDQCIDEILEVDKNYKYGTVVFADDILTLNIEWFEEFIAKYTEKINRAFIFNARVECLSETQIRLIANSPCVLLRLGIESASDKIRTLMQRTMSKEDISNIFQLAHKNGLRTCSYNMIGYPSETIADFEETFNLNLQLSNYAIQNNTEHLGIVNVFYPYRGTKAGDMCYEQGWVDDNIHDIHPHIEYGLTTPYMSKGELYEAISRWPFETGG